MAHSFQFLKGGDSESLKFPSFRRELLQQNFWSHAYDLDRINIVISEGFPRDSQSLPVERVKNIVALSFQHAPPGIRIEVLERSGIAWPNSMMWRRAPFASMPTPNYPLQHAELHTHSPRRPTDLISGHASTLSGNLRSISKREIGQGSRRVVHPISDTMLAVSGSTRSSGDLDGFGETNFCLKFLNSVGMGLTDMNQTETQGNNQPKNARRSSTDISMPDYVPMEAGDQLATPTEQPFLLVGMRQEEEDPSSNLRVPENTPIANGQGGNEHDAVLVLFLSSSIPSELANSLTHSLLNQPMPLHFQQPNFHMPAGEIKSRKENRRQKPIIEKSMPALVPGSSTASLEHQEIHRVSQQMHVSSSSSVPNCRASSRLNSPRTQDCTERQSQRAVSMGVEINNTP